MLMESDAKNFIDSIRTCSQNSEGLHCEVQKQLASSRPEGGRGIKRVLREA
jgi:hypothetical protein